MGMNMKNYEQVKKTKVSDYRYEKAAKAYCALCFKTKKPQLKTMLEMNEKDGVELLAQESWFQEYALKNWVKKGFTGGKGDPVSDLHTMAQKTYVYFWYDFQRAMKIERRADELKRQGERLRKTKLSIEELEYCAREIRRECDNEYVELHLPFTEKDVVRRKEKLMTLWTTEAGQTCLTTILENDFWKIYYEAWQSTGRFVEGKVVEGKEREKIFDEERMAKQIIRHIYNTRIKDRMQRREDALKKMNSPTNFIGYHQERPYGR